MNPRRRDRYQSCLRKTVWVAILIGFVPVSANLAAWRSALDTASSPSPRPPVFDPPGATAQPREGEAPSGLHSDAGGDTHTASSNVTSPAGETTWRLVGSNTLGEKLVPAWLDAFVSTQGGRITGRIVEDRYHRLFKLAGPPEFPPAVQISAHGDGTAFVDLGAGRADIAMASRRISDRETARLVMLGDMRSPAAEHIVAMDGIAILVNPDNPLMSVSLEQVAAIYRCQITDWAQLGGPPGPIKLYARNPESGTYALFSQLIMKNAPLCRRVIYFESSEMLSQRIRDDRNAIGFTSLAYGDQAKALAIEQCGIAYPPDPFSVKNESYPLSRRLYLYVPPRNPRPVSRAFLRWVQTEAAQDIARRLGFVDLNIISVQGTEPTHQQRLSAAGRLVKNSEILAQYRRLTTQARRLSSTFYFDFGLVSLDNRAKRDLLRLADYLRDLEAAGPEVIVLGFTDDHGDYTQNLHLSRIRAETVARELQRLGVRVAEARGFGEEAPAACNQRRRDRVRNRHVEVWLR